MSGIADGPLSDLRVLDVSPYLPGPLATQMLADLGATVIKVEPPAGDPARRLPGGPYEVANRNKRSIALDLKTAEDRQRCRRLAAGADVLVEGFRPGVAERLGVSYAQLRPVNPALVYCSLSGFGQAGPQRSAPGHDITYLAASGALSFPGSWHDGQPRRPGVPVADLAAAGYATVAILAALHDRRSTGHGCYLDIALADAAMAFTAVRAGPQLDNRGTDRLHLNPTNDLFGTADGVIAVGAVEEHFWRRLREVLVDHEPGLADARFDDAVGRRAYGDELTALLRRAFTRRTAQEWFDVLSEADVPAEVVRPMSVAVNSDQVRQRGIVQTDADQRHVVFPVLRDGMPMGRLRFTAQAARAQSPCVLAELDAGGDPWHAGEVR